MSTPSSNRRRQQIINPRFQWRFLRNILLLEAFVFAVAVLVTLAADHLVLNPAVGAGGYWRGLTLTVTVLFVLLALVLLYLGVRLSNRISGPLYRVRVVLDEVARGSLPTACLIRDGDEHPEVAEALDHALAALRRREEHRRDALLRLAETAAEPLAGELRRLAEAGPV
jgi:methyl-accepting chemotaxis protein